MKGRFVLTPCAQADLDEIWEYTTERWDIDQAERTPGSFGSTSKP